MGQVLLVIHVTNGLHQLVVEPCQIYQVAWKVIYLTLPYLFWTWATACRKHFVL